MKSLFKDIGEHKRGCKLFGMFILRAEVAPGKYTYAQFNQGECAFDTEQPIIPLEPELYCGVSWLNIPNDLQPGTYEIVLIDCFANSGSGLEQCDKFVENLTVSIE